ncbi:MAG TPA: hypothetical protein VFR87_09325 [Nocardioidaceae bacterium]|nr:hypothetical protein [Nocardioidaceae bacterium]
MVSPETSHHAVDEPTEETIASGILGIVVSSAVMASAHVETVWQLALAVLATLLVYWAAERYARVVSRRIVDGRRPSWPVLRRELTEGWAMVTGSTLPLLVLVVLGLLGTDYRTTVLVALGTNTALLALAGWRVGRDERLNTAERVASAAFAGLFGLLAIVFKTLVH